MDVFNANGVFKVFENNVFRTGKKEMNTFSLL